MGKFVQKAAIESVCDYEGVGLHQEKGEKRDKEIFKRRPAGG
ncbi:MAG: hypothetical protein QW046_01760 [Candidatus Micrarchaeaceae archaeon]